MPLTEVKTEKVKGNVTNVYIGKDANNGVNIKQGILSFEYWREHDNLRLEIPASPTRDIAQQLGMSYFRWKLRFVGDCRQAFFATDVQAASGNQFAMIDNNLSNKIEYFRVLVAIETASGNPGTRTYTITGGYALRNHAYIGDYRDAEYEYEGDAEYISYSDS